MSTRVNPEAYRIYRLRAGDLEVVATCGSNEAVGTAIVTLGQEGEFEGCTVGVMHRPFEDKPGIWLVNPFPRSEDTKKSRKLRRLKGKPPRRTK